MTLMCDIFDANPIILTLVSTLWAAGDPVAPQPVKAPKKTAAPKPKPHHAGPGKHEHKPGPKAKGHKKKGH